MKKHSGLLTISFAVLFIYSVSTPISASGNLPSAITTAIDTITEDDGIAIISELASEEFGGRMTGFEGQWLTAHLIKKEFEKSGLKPYGSANSFYQKFPLATNRILPTPLLEVKIGDIEYTNYEFGTNFICRGFSGAGDIRAEVVFCGYGITMDGYDDYANVDVEGKIVFIMNGQPAKPKSMKHRVSEWDVTGNKVNNAIGHGAIGMMMIRSKTSGRLGKLIGSVLWGDYKHQPEFPVLVIDRFVAADIFKKSQQDLPVLQAMINRSLKPISFYTGTAAHIRVDVDYRPTQETCNVVGIIEGSHPRLKNEYVVIGAHMDHVGTQGLDIMFPGANDNATGIAALIEIVRAFNEANLKPKRSIIFAAFTGEEMGSKGSHYFVDHLPFPKSKIKYMLNMDMLGQGDNCLNTFSKQFPEITAKVKKANRNLHNLAIQVIPSGFGSDHVSFFNAGIPSGMLLTCGEYDYPYHHTHYHYREWMIEINLWKKSADTALLTLWYLAN
ncbi:M20/M25/M40 family metallo-hydrolase [bacterium]|nr:M20/M25/M40 family metallo-hydrolase [bacterium]